jgi:uncharacterized membrane protein
MNLFVILSVVLIGSAAGLRALTPPAIVAWCAYLGALDLSAGPFSFLSSWITVALLSLFALGEYVGDLLPAAPNRTELPGLIARVLTGLFSAACLLSASRNSMFASVVGGVAAIIGAYVGLWIRVRLVNALKAKDVLVGIPEDLIAIGLSIAAMVAAA